MVSVKTQTLGPNEATFASGQMDAASAIWDGTAANPAPATSAAATRTGRHRQRRARPLVILLISFTFAPSALIQGLSPQGFIETSDYTITGTSRRKRNIVKLSLGGAPEGSFARDLPGTISGLNLAVTLLTRHKHQSPAINNPLTGLSRHPYMVYMNAMQGR
jgi:hypothetical protein